MGKGDQIYTMQPLIHWQGVYEHHGIDCGDGTVIHLRKRNQLITRSPFLEFTDRKQVYIKSYPISYIPDVVVNRAKSRLGEKVNYNLLFNNCEHFATWCKTGYAYSRQVRHFIPRLSQLKVDNMASAVEQALQSNQSPNQDELVNEALNDIKQVWDQIQPRYTHALQEMETWQAVAWQALQQGKEKVAKAALKRKLCYRKQVEKDQQQLEQLAKMSETLLKNRLQSP